MLKTKFINLEKIKLSNTLPNQYTIVIFEDDKPLNYFTDDCWDFKDYITSYAQATVIDFSKSNLSDDSKYYVKLCLYYYIYYYSNNAAGLSFNTIEGKYSDLRRLAILCESFKLNFSNMRDNVLYFNALIDTLATDNRMLIEKYISILSLISKTGIFFNLENFGISKNQFSKLYKMKKVATKEPNQTILIPSRILADFIYKSTEFFQLYHSVRSELIDFINHEKFTSRRPSKGFRCSFRKLLINLNISNELKLYFDKYSITQRPHLISHFLYIQSLGSAFISCFSGMRKNEITNLPYYCLEEITNKADNSKTFILNNFTSKLTKLGVVSAIWVTSKQVVQVIEILQDIAKLHKFLLSIGFIEEKIINIPLEEYPLLPIFNQQKHPVGINPLYDYATLFTPTLGKNIYKIIEPIIIEKSDLEELFNFNMLVDWENDYNIQIGHAWNFAYHQFRRSLAVYASRSNIVKLPALKKQLKHISFSMTMYYGNNFHNAKNLNFQKDIVNEYRAERELFQFSSFSHNVIENDSVLFGAKGTYFELQKTAPHQPKYLTDRQQTLKHIKAGRIFYKKTPLGGCGKSDNCNKLSFAFATACVTCSEAIFDDNSLVALNTAKENYLKQIDKLDENSITYKQFRIEIDAIDRVLAKRNLLEDNNV